MSKFERICLNCRHWQDYRHRVHVVVRDSDAADLGAGLRADARGLAELRPCLYRPNPTVEKAPVQVFTGERYVCDDYSEKTT